MIGTSPGGFGRSPEKKASQEGEVLPHGEVELEMVPFMTIAPCPGAGPPGEEAGTILLDDPISILSSPD